MRLLFAVGPLKSTACSCGRRLSRSSCRAELSPRLASAHKKDGGFLAKLVGVLRRSGTSDSTHFIHHNRYVFHLALLHLVIVDVTVCRATRPKVGNFFKRPSRIFSLYNGLPSTTLTVIVHCLQFEITNNPEYERCCFRSHGSVYLFGVYVAHTRHSVLPSNIQTALLIRLKCPS